MSLLDFPFTALNSAFADLDRLINEAVPAGRNKPAADVWANDDGVVIQLATPGFSKEDLTIDIAHDTVTVSGKQADNDDDNRTGEWVRRERQQKDFSRSFKLNFVVDAEATRARYDNGVLTLELPKPASAKARTVDIE